MTSDFTDQIRAKMIAREERRAAAKQQADQTAEQAAVGAAKVAESWRESRESIVRPTLSVAAQAIRDGGSEAVLNETADHVGVVLTVTPNGDGYSPTLTIAPNSMLEEIVALASIGKGSRSVKITAFNSDWLEAAVNSFLGDVFGDTERPSQNW